MTILWCGGEDIDFPVMTAIINTSTIYRRTAFARSAFQMSNGTLLKSPALTPFSSAWLSCQFYRSGWASTDQRVIIGFGKSGTEALIGIGTTTTIGKVGIVTYDGSTWNVLATEAGTSFTTSVIYKIDLRLINYGSNGSFFIYLNGVLVASYTGNIAVLGQTTLDQVYAFGGSSTSGFGFMSEFILADEDTRRMSLKTLAPNAAGDTNNWTGAYTAIDEAVMDETDSVYVNSAEQDFMCNLTGMPTGNFTCRALKTAISAGDGTGSLGVQIGLKTGGSTNFGNTLTLDDSWQLKENIWQQNPITASNFTPAEIESLQSVVRSKSV